MNSVALLVHVMVIEVVFLWCVQEMAKLKEEDITAATDTLTATALYPQHTEHGRRRDGGASLCRIR